MKEPGWRRLPRIRQREALDDGDDELRFHLEMRARDYMEQGMSEDDAWAAAHERLGDVDEVRREIGRVGRAQTRARHRREWLGDLEQDIRYGCRSLLRAPTFTSMSALTLALGIGATTAIFSLVWAVLLAPLPYSQPDRLVRVWETSPQGATRNVVSAGNVLDWQRRARSFTVLGAHTQPYPVTLTDEGDAARVAVSVIQPAVMRVLDAVPVLGRTLVEADGIAGDVAVLSHELWQSRYGGDPLVLGSRIAINDVPRTVVGVMPRSFDYPSDEVELWMSLRVDQLDPESRTSHNYVTVARLEPDATLQSAQEEMRAIAAQIAEAHPAEMTGWSARVVPLHEDITRNVESLFWLLLGAVAVVLLITCGNLANLLLARAVTREREIAVRGALGAGRGRILRQLLTESGLLALLGALGALVTSPLLLSLLVAAAPADVPLLNRAAIDLRMLAFAAAIALGSALLFGLAPAVRASRSDIEAALRAGRDSSRSTHVRLRSALLVGQVSLSVVLLVGAGLFVRSFRALADAELGFDPDRVVLMDVDLPDQRYPETPEQTAFYERLIERVRSVPGLSAAGTSQPPGSGAGMTFSFAIEGREASNPNGREDDETLHAVTPGYFEVLGQRVVAGRAFDARDGADGAPVVILNESLAKKHFPDGGALGNRIAFRVGETPWREIVGVVSDARLESPDVEPEPGIFIPFAQKTWPWLTWTTIVVRAAPGIDMAPIPSALRSVLRELDPQLPPHAIRSVRAEFRENVGPRMFAMALVTGFGVLALVLSIVGLYGLITYSVARQRREIGVRMALGAGSGAVVGSVLLRSARLSALGAGGGMILAFAVTRVIENLLFGVSRLDAPTYALTVAIVMGVALATASLPALRAARTDPIHALAGR